MNEKMIGQLEIILGYSFIDKSLLVTALTHTSYANEHNHKDKNNQRLEFLGDSVLDLLVSVYIYHKNPKMQEGELTKLRAALVCESTLYNLAWDLCINEYLLLGAGEYKHGEVKVSILADAFESIVAAIFLDGGIIAAQRFIERNMDKLFKYGSTSILKINYKTELQEKYAKSKMDIVYTIVDIKGPEHDCVYTAKVTVGDCIYAYGEGKTKKEAEQNAAKNILENK